MNALHLLRRLTPGPAGLITFAILCLWPVGSGLWVMFTHHHWMLMDIDAVLCGAKTLSKGHSPYAIHPHACDGIRPAAYVYAPQIAQLFIPFIKVFGVAGTRWIFIAVLLGPATLMAVWFALIRPMPGVEIRARLLAFAALTAMTFVCANVGLVMHVLVLVSLLAFPKTRWPFTVAVLACACIKPTFLTYFVIFLLDDTPLWRRGLDFGWRAVAGGGFVWLLMHSAGHFGKAWQKTLHSVTLSRQVGMGWFELTDYVFHIPTGTMLNIELAAGFMAVMVLSGMAIARWGRLEPGERLVLGMGLVPLMTPRLLDYDMVLIVPFAALMISVMARIGPRLVLLVASWTYVAWLGFGIALSLMNRPAWSLAWHRTPMDMLLFGILTLLAGLCALGRGLLSGDRPQPRAA